MTSPQPTPSTTQTTAKTAQPAAPDPNRPGNPADAALFDAVAAEHGAIYGYGVVSAHSTPDENDLVADAMAQHRERREQAIARLTARKVAVPLPAVGYQLPLEVSDPTQAAQLAVRMEEDTAVAWRAVLEQATTTEDRSFAVTALTQSAVLAARWSRVLGAAPVTLAFPGGTE
ncbi:ferritin-like domain-containing protein [Mycolicibacterium sp. 120266]|uniref:ferritin-like domain-containing protein n=1 Tax=Mycolicibacterium sp. 120266 TaxID=3090601 RepID=UPI00299E663C|nr:ferritin-like domain-containing protein [Mycolicibacterium sp. 120266]MDX1874895.1 ferritin-like domain-containing protein [Mycolicibacterium sp. 120266]